MKLIFQVRSGDEEWKSIEQTISFEQTKCNFGGYRKWFICPRCLKRVVILYGTGECFFCRKCYNLTYNGQLETAPFRLTSKAQKIRRRLGASINTCDAITERPKGMHRRTFE